MSNKAGHAALWGSIISIVLAATLGRASTNGLDQRTRLEKSAESAVRAGSSYTHGPDQSHAETARSVSDQAATPKDELRAFADRQVARLRVEGARAPDPAPWIHDTSISAERLDRRSVAASAERCAPTTPASTLVSIAEVESGFNPLAIRVNGGRPRMLRPADSESAVRMATALIGRGMNIDLGLAQINSANLGWLGLSVADAFSPCRNLAAAGRILDRGYARALQVDHSNRPVLQMAYSIYNSGDAERGVDNGYAAKVEAARRRLDPRRAY